MDLESISSRIHAQLDELLSNQEQDQGFPSNDSIQVDTDPHPDPAAVIILSEQDSIQTTDHSIRAILGTRDLSSTGLDIDQLTDSILNLCQNLLGHNSSDHIETALLDNLSNQILDLLGFEAIDLVPLIIQELQSNGFRKSINSSTSHGNLKEPTLPDNPESFDLAFLESLKARKLIEAANRPRFLQEGFVKDEIINPHIFDAARLRSADHAFTTASGQKFILPIGTTRSSHEFFEEIKIPPHEKLPIRSDERLINIEELDPISRKCFPGYKTLNRLQSAVFPIAYKTNENMLVCAPTGAGKTDVAMLTILRAISQYGGLNLDSPTKGLRNDFKIIYVAPMKALAAEIVRKMGKRLGWLGAVVKELTGDMQLTRDEINATHLIVTTPEKWDVVTRKSSGEEGLVSRVRLLIIDEVHLLHEDRGAVIETIVARTLRQVESSQSLIRIVGLSATLPNYIDVSDFLRVNRMQGLFYFDSSFRPVPLEQHFIGVRGKPNSATSRNNLDKAAFEKVSELIKEGHQVMVFVHARKETVKTAQMLKEKAMEEDLIQFFDPAEHPKYDSFKRELSGSANKQMKELIESGFGIHHAGMLRSDRNINERLFETGVTRVLCCTATLAWGVNLPAYAVVIKGTQLYDASKGSFVDLGILDVLQIFGRAGRPQYEDHGVGYICTTHDRLDHYVAAITQQHPIESQFVAGMVDSLNAEIALGTVRTVDEGVQWIGWTYLFVRMRKNPMVYGLTISDVENDPLLGQKRHSLIEIAAKKLHQIGMIIFDQVTGSLEPTELGRIASKYYIKNSSIEIFNECFRAKMTEADVLAMLSQSVEFEQIKVRDSELDELERLQEQAPCQVKGGPTSTFGKVNILLQAHVSRAFIEDFALVSDTAYVAQNAARIARALVEISVWKKFAETLKVTVEISKCIEKRLWPFNHPLSQSGLSNELVYDLDERAGDLEVEDLAEMTASEIASSCRLNDRLGNIILRAARQFPRLSIDYTLQPLTESLLRVRLHLSQTFDWSAKTHGRGEPFWVWIESGDQQEILRITRIYLRQSVPEFDLDFILSFANTSFLPDGLFIRVVSDGWIGSDNFKEIFLKDLIMCPTPPESTPLLDLPLLATSSIEQLNQSPQPIGLPHQLSPIESQCFHTLFHTPHDALICAPEQQALNRLATLTITRTLKLSFHQTKNVVIVITPQKFIARQLGALFNRSLKSFSLKISVLVEPSDLSWFANCKPNSSSIVVMTPKVGSVMPLSFYQSSFLIIFMNLHHMSQDYERVINNIMKNHSTSRLVGFSYSLMDPRSLSNWLRIEESHVSNFSPASRSQPILFEFLPLNKPYSSTQWKTMIKPAWKIIKDNPNSSVLMFVPSKHQCQAVAQHLVQCYAFNMGQGDARSGGNEDLWAYAEQFENQAAANMLVHGLFMIDQKITAREIRLGMDLFRMRKVKIMILSCESSWRISNEQVKVETVIVMGTRRSVTFPAVDGGLPTQTVSEMELSDLVQMQSFLTQTTTVEFEQSTTNQFVVMCEEDQLETYATFLKSGLPLESTIELESSVYLDLVLDRLVYEVSGKSKTRNRSEIMECLSGTLLLERLRVNPLYYGIDTRHGRGNEGSDEEKSGWDGSAVVDKWVEQLVELGCVRSLGIKEVEVTEIGNRLVQQHVSVNKMVKLKKWLKENPRKKTEKLVQELVIQSDFDLIDLTKEFYTKLPRHLKDKSAWFLQEIQSDQHLTDNEKDQDQDSSKVRKNDGLVKRLLVDCFEVGRIAYNHPILVQQQAHLILQLILKSNSSLLST